MTRREVIEVPGTPLEWHTNLEVHQDGRVLWQAADINRAATPVEGARLFKVNTDERARFQQYGGTIALPAVAEYGDTGDPDKITGFIYGVKMPRGVFEVDT